MSVRRVCYVSGTRADFGLMARTLRLIHDHPALELGIMVTGMHLSPKYGETVREVIASGLPIQARIPTTVEESSGAAMARAIGQTVVGLVSEFEKSPPNIVLLLGDRGEMLAGAIAAIHLNIPVAHIHGGERSGTVDEPVRHAISKLSHYHFVATRGARDRLIGMGENPERVFITGAPGLDGIESVATLSRESLCEAQRLDPGRPVCLVVYHPVLQEAQAAELQARAVAEGVLRTGVQVLALEPNADAGGDLIRGCLREYVGHPDFRLATHVPRGHFVSWMKHAHAMVGNSSSGIIEAASLGLWVLNVGSRQRLRERSGNVIDVAPNADQIASALGDVLKRPRATAQNIYGDGHAGERIAELLAGVTLDPSLLMKTNAY